MVSSKMMFEVNSSRELLVAHLILDIGKCSRFFFIRKNALPKYRNTMYIFRQFADRHGLCVAREPGGLPNHEEITDHYVAL